jgi:hypothetical protein
VQNSGVWTERLTSLTFLANTVYYCLGANFGGSEGRYNVLSNNKFYKSLTR